MLDTLHGRTKASLRAANHNCHAQLRFMPATRALLTPIPCVLFDFHTGDETSVHLADHPVDATLRHPRHRCQLVTKAGGVSFGDRAHRPGADGDPVMLFDLLHRGSKRTVSAAKSVTTRCKPKLYERQLTRAACTKGRTI
ncbi:MAG: hypothetical protein ACRD9R_20105 [Pyrinomonadaceae bacterium]